ncbi:hypothetical protein F5883DRAFT_714797 [Diaporthe sp. PMI_573]|nr:hypothetical protein F5883DRAFT_714797 [Diaporthaceae sp. PMI_573]
MAGVLAVGTILALARPAFAAPVIEESVVSAPATTVTSAAAMTASVVPSTSIFAASVPALPPNPAKYDYAANGELHADQPAPYTPAGGLGTNGSEPLYRVQSDFDYQSIAVACNMLGHNAPKQCSYNYPSMNVREYVDFSQKLARWGESGVYGFLNHFDSREQMIFRQFNGQFPIPVWFEVGIPQSWAWTLLAPYISSCPEGTQQLIWQNFPALNILNQPNPARINGADVWNETRGGYANTLSTDDIEPEDACADSDVIGENCSPAITHNRTAPLSYPGRQVFLQWEESGQAVDPNNSYVTSTSAGVPKFALWASQLNVTYSPLMNVSGNSAYTIQPNVSTYEGDPAINGTMFLALTDEDLYVTPFNLSSVNHHVYALALYQAG